MSLAASSAFLEEELAVLEALLPPPNVSNNHPATQPLVSDAIEDHEDHLRHKTDEADDASSCGSCSSHWELPVGAESIVRTIAAEELTHRLLNQLGRPCREREAVLVRIVDEFPSVCLRTYEFDWEDHKTRQLFPLAMILCLEPQLATVQKIYHASPQAIRLRESSRGSLPLHFASAFEATLDVVQFVYAQYPQAVEMARYDGVIALHLACGYYRGTPDVVDFLLAQYPLGAQQRCREIEWYPLHSAASGGTPAFVLERLGQLSPESVQAVDRWGRTALHHACRSKRKIHHQPQLSTESLSSSSPDSADAETLQAVQTLIRLHPQAISMTDVSSFAPLTLAAMHQSVAVLQTLIQHGGPAVHHQIPMDEVSGGSLLHWAALQNSRPVVEFLIQEYPEMVTTRTLDENAYTPLMAACINGGPLENIRALVELHPAGLELQDRRGRTALEAAVEEGVSRDIVKLLLQAPSSSSVLSRSTDNR